MKKLFLAGKQDASGGVVLYTIMNSTSSVMKSKKKLEILTAQYTETQKAAIDAMILLLLISLEEVSVDKYKKAVYKTKDFGDLQQTGMISIKYTALPVQLTRISVLEKTNGYEKTLTYLTQMVVLQVNQILKITMQILEQHGVNATQLQIAQFVSSQTAIFVSEENFTKKESLIIMLISLLVMKQTVERQQLSSLMKHNYIILEMNFA